jgi:hypothetical protein
MSVVRELNKEKKELINQRHILLCDNCYWCLTYLPDLENDAIEYFGNCPKCHKNIRQMYISEQASRRPYEKEVQDINESGVMLVA